MTPPDSTFPDRAFPGLSLDELALVTRRFAREVREGCHEVHASPDERWHVRIHGDDQVDVWLIGWTTDQDTELHDHGGSAGAFTVVEGALTEAVWHPGEGLCESTRQAHETVVFGSGYVHDVRNTAEEVAVSVHAYSPPLVLMHYYAVERGRLLQRDRVWTDDPEAPRQAS